VDEEITETARTVQTESFSERRRTGTT